MRGLQVAVGLVLRIARAVVGQRIGLVHALGAGRVAQVVGSPFVDIVAQKRHQVGIGGGDMAVRRIAAELPVLARGDRQQQPRRHASRRGRGAGAPGRADRVAQHEAVPVPARRFQPLDVDMHAVRQRGRGGRRALGGDAGKGLVVRHFPAHRERHRRARLRVERIGQDAGPENDGVGQRRT